MATVNDIVIELLYENSMNYFDDQLPKEFGNNVNEETNNANANATTELDKRKLLFSHSQEGYRLYLNETCSRLTAYTVAGLMHGLNTLAQLTVAPRLLPLPLEIIDWPSNPWRGG
jgi:N-acetyl-beta-hexosaminidase